MTSMKAANVSAKQPAMGSFIRPPAPQNKFSSYMSSQWQGPEGFLPTNVNSQQVPGAIQLPMAAPALVREQDSRVKRQSSHGQYSHPSSLELGNIMMGNSIIEEQTTTRPRYEEHEAPLARDCETPCFYKETQRDGFAIPKNHSRLRTENKKPNGRVSKEASLQRNTDEEDFYENSSDNQKFGSQRDSLPFPSTELDSCEKLTAGDSMDRLTLSLRKQKNSATRSNKKSFRKAAVMKTRDTLFDNISSSAGVSDKGQILQLAAIKQQSESQNQKAKNLHKDQREQARKQTFGSGMVQDLKVLDKSGQPKKSVRLDSKNMGPPSTAATAATVGSQDNFPTTVGSPSKSLQQRINNSRRQQVQ